MNTTSVGLEILEHELSTLGNIIEPSILEVQRYDCYHEFIFVKFAILMSSLNYVFEFLVGWCHS